jgi:predicted kinase
MVLLGNSGAGKSLYLVQLFREIELLKDQHNE